MRIDLDVLSRYTSQKTMQRGRSYHRRGRVQLLATDAPRFAGLAQGSAGARYQVMLTLGASGEPEHWHCSCPSDWDPMCKHGVALALTIDDYLRAQPREAGPVAQREARAPLVPLKVIARLDELGLAHFLDCEAFVILGGRDEELNEAYDFQTTRQLVTQTNRQPWARVRSPGFWHALKQAVELLHARAEAGLARELDRQQAWASIDGPLAGLARQLIHLRTQMRATAPPLADPQWTVPPVDWLPHRDLVRIQLPADLADLDANEGGIRVHLGNPVRVECDYDCPGCSSCLFALDHLLDVLAGAHEPAVRAALEQHAGSATWRRALGRLKAAEEMDRPAEGGREREIGWQVTIAPYVTLHPVSCRPKVRGAGWTTRKIRPEEVLGYTGGVTAADRRLARLGLGSMSGYGYHSSGPDLLLELAGHPRVFLGYNGSEPVTVRRLATSVVAAPDGDGARLALRLGDDLITGVGLTTLLTDHLEGDTLVLLSSATPGRRPDTLTVAPLEPRALRLLTEFQGADATIPANELGPALQAIGGLLDEAPEIDRALLGEALPRQSERVVRLQLGAADQLVAAVRVRVLDGSAPLLPGAGTEVAYGQRGERFVHTVRAFDEEVASARALTSELGLDPDEPSGFEPFSWVLTGEAAAALVDTLSQRSDVSVEWDGRRVAVVADEGARLRVQGRGAREWLSVGGELDLGDVHVGLSGLIDAIRDGRRYVQLSQDRYVRISERIRGAIEPLAAAAEQDAGGEWQIFPLLVSALDGVESAGGDLELPPEWIERRNRIHEAAALTPADPPALQASLRPYQREGFQWLMRLSRWAPGACLADDMGLGKTVQTLALLLERVGEGPVLVVAPTSVGFNWQREAARFAPGLRCQMFRGRAHLDRLAGLAAGDVVITSYDLAYRYVEDLTQTRWGTLVLDEAQAIKNPATRRARAIRQIEAGFVLALTGTPIENHPGELWSLFRVIVPGLLGSLDSFKERYLKPIADGDLATRRGLAGRIRPFVLRRLKSEVARDLPPRTDAVVDVELSKAERTLYDEARTDALRQLEMFAGQPGGQGRLQALAALTRVRQLACHPRLVIPSSTVSSSKLATLLELIDELRSEGHRALVFSQFTTFLGLVRAALEERGVTFCYLDGSTPEVSRRQQVDAFQRGRGDVFLLSLKAGGTGLNLTAADYVIHLDPWWNPAVEDQATDRAHRIGQERPVTVYRLIARDTIEAAIVELHEQKRDLAGALLEGTGRTARLSVEEMMALLSGAVPDDEPTEEVLDAGDLEPDDELPAASPADPNRSARLLASLDTVLAQAISDGRLRRKVTVRNYRRAAGRIVEYLDQCHPWTDGATVAAGVERYADAVSVGAWDAPRSDTTLGRAAGRWLAAAADHLLAEGA